MKHVYLCSEDAVGAVCYAAVAVDLNCTYSFCLTGVMGVTGHTVQGCAHCHSSSVSASTSGRIQASAQSQPDWLKSSSVRLATHAKVAKTVVANATLKKIKHKQRNNCFCRCFFLYLAVWKMLAGTQTTTCQI